MQIYTSLDYDWLAVDGGVTWPFIPGYFLASEQVFLIKAYLKLNRFPSLSGDWLHYHLPEWSSVIIQKKKLHALFPLNDADSDLSPLVCQFCRAAVWWRATR